MPTITITLADAIYQYVLLARIFLRENFHGVDDLIFVTNYSGRNSQRYLSHFGTNWSLDAHRSAMLPLLMLADGSSGHQISIESDVPARRLVVLFPCSLESYLMSLSRKIHPTFFGYIYDECICEAPI